jgi:molybdate transport system substrate-binding protein
MFLLVLVIVLLMLWRGLAGAQAAAFPRNAVAGRSQPLPIGPAVHSLLAAAAALPRVQGELTVFAAASLAEVFKELGARIEEANPGTKVRLNFAGSPTLRTQLAQGARADVFAAADETTMQGAQQDGAINGEARIFAYNRLVVIVPSRNPAGLTTLQDLAKPRVKLVLTHKEVPAGSYARQALAKMSHDPAFGPEFSGRVLANLVSEETNVKHVVTKVQLGEADAGIGYATDVTPAVRRTIKVLDIPHQFNVLARYPMAVVRGTANEAGARAFLDYVLSPLGQAILSRHGFMVPGS